MKKSPEQQPTDLVITVLCFPTKTKIQKQKIVMNNKNKPITIRGNKDD